MVGILERHKESLKNSKVFKDYEKETAEQTRKETERKEREKKFKEQQEAVSLWKARMSFLHDEISKNKGKVRNLEKLRDTFQPDSGEWQDLVLDIRQQRRELEGLVETFAKCKAAQPPTPAPLPKE